MLVRNCTPGDIVEARGWDIALSANNPGVGWLVPHNLNHKKSVEEGWKSVLLYVGPAYIMVDDTHRKMHNFLTEDGDSVFLEGAEFKYLDVCTT